jgi:chaperonin GroEL (HSP60 family)
MTNGSMSSLFLSKKAMVKRIANAKIACLDFNLQKTKMKLGVQIVVDDPNKLDAIRERYGHFRRSEKGVWKVVSIPCILLYLGKVT